MVAKRWLSDVLVLAAKALGAGAVRKGHTEIVWDISGRCANSFTTEYHARPSRADNVNRMVVVKRGSQHPMCVTIITKCHKCAICLRERAALWTARAVQECNDASRTWFGTLTLSPEAWMLALSRARARERAQGVDYDQLPPPERFALWNSQIQVEITKYLKRVRMEAIRLAGAPDNIPQSPIRYLFVVEKHQSGVPHYHALIHETLPGIPVRKHTLDDQWKLGFTKWRLIPDLVETENGAYAPSRYVCKYLQKDAFGRTRASIDYGVARLGATPTLRRVGRVFRPQGGDHPTCTDLGEN